MQGNDSMQPKALDLKSGTPLRNAFIASALVACGCAQAVSLNPRGVGQVLVYPYYTVNNNQDTLITVGNASDTGKVVKVQFNEGMNGRIVLDFNLFLSPRDVWTARVSELAAEDGAGLFSSDRSCTWPVLGPGEQFTTTGYDGGSLVPADGGPTGPGRTREGYIRLFALGEIIPGSTLEDAIIHQQTGVPGEGTPTCEEAEIGIDIHEHLVTPDDTLYGSASIVNVGEGTFFAYGADALADFTDVPLVTTTLPYMASAYSSESGSFGAIAHVLDHEGHYVALDYEIPAHAVSAVFMADSLLNEYLVAPGLGAHTDWIVTFPTRELYTDIHVVPGDASPPFPRASVTARADVEFTLALFDQEEGGGGMPIDDFGVPIMAGTPSLPYQVNVLAFRAIAVDGMPSAVFGSTLATNVAPYGIAGWARMDLASGDGGHALPDANDGTVLLGLPVTGFMVYNIINADAAPGRLANYGGVFPHRTTIVCFSQAQDGSPTACGNGAQ
jgi:hypothetical protein